MKNEKQFENWLQTSKGLSKETAETRLSNCRRLDEVYDLDKQYALNQCSGLIRSFSYTKRAAALSVPVLHKVQIDGNLYNGTATLRSATRLYVEFMNALQCNSKNGQKSKNRG